MFKDSSTVTIFDTKSQIRKPGILLFKMYNDLCISLPLAYRLSIRDFISKYRRSVLGILWVVMQPIAYAVFFVLLQKSKILALESSEVPYFIFVFSGIIIWQFFIESLLIQLNTIKTNQHIIVKQQFPKEAIILSAILSFFYIYIIKNLVLLVVLVIYYDLFSIGHYFIFLLMTVPIIIAGNLIGILFAPLSLVFSDIENFLTSFSFYLMLSVPIVYEIPDAGIMRIINILNPLTYLLTSTRNALLGLEPVLTPEFIVITVSTIVFFLFGWALYRLALPILIEKISS